MNPVRMSCLLFALLVALPIGVPVMLARAESVQVVCESDICATTRAGMEAIARELERLRGLIDRQCL